MKGKKIRAGRIGTSRPAPSDVTGATAARRAHQKATRHGQEEFRFRGVEEDAIRQVPLQLDGRWAARTPADESLWDVEKPSPQSNRSNP
jgi:hypothetical protein